MLGVILGLLAATAALVVAVLQAGDSSEAPVVASAADTNQLPEELRKSPAPDFHLTDARGGVIDTKDLRGRPYVVTFLYANCPDVCPLIGQELKAALERLGADAKRAAVVAVSVDPTGDTREVVRDFLRRHRLPANFHYGIGSHEELEPVWEAYYAAPQIPGRPESAHSASLWFVDAQGRLRAHMSAGFPVDPKDIAGQLRPLLAEA